MSITALWFEHQKHVVDNLYKTYEPEPVKGCPFCWEPELLSKMISGVEET